MEDYLKIFSFVSSINPLYRLKTDYITKNQPASKQWKWSKRCWESSGWVGGWQVGWVGNIPTTFIPQPSFGWIK